MKNNPLLLLAPFAFIAAGVSASPINPLETEVVILPTYVVTTSRGSSVEKQIRQNLESAAQRATARLEAKVDLPLFQPQNTKVEVALGNAPGKSRLTGKS